MSRNLCGFGAFRLRHLPGGADLIAPPVFGFVECAIRLPEKGEKIEVDIENAVVGDGDDTTTKATSTGKSGKSGKATKGTESGTTETSANAGTTTSGSQAGEGGDGDGNDLV